MIINPPVQKDSINRQDQGPLAWPKVIIGSSNAAWAELSGRGMAPVPRWVRTSGFEPDPMRSMEGLGVGFTGILRITGSVWDV